MPSELCLHIGVNGRHRDGDILRVTFTYDAQRVIAETISNGRHSAVNRGKQAASIGLLREHYLDITDPDKQPQPVQAGLDDWWDACETLTGLNRNDFSRFPYTSREQQLFLIVPLDREATLAERAEWTGKTAAAASGDPVPVPNRVDWQADVMPGHRVRRDRSGDRAATIADVQNSKRLIRVLDPISPSVIRSRA